MEISQTKREFLKRVGIDLENLPEEFNRAAESYSLSLTKEEKEFLFSNSYSAPFILPFSMKDVVGTNHPSYQDITFLEAFLKSQRGDENIRMFYNNPSYYSETLKQPDQSNRYAGHDTPIELNRDAEGNCFIMGGNNRLCLLMMTYLKELSAAKTKEEKEVVNKKYTFYAEVRSLPKDKDVSNTIFLLKEIYQDNIKFSFKGENPDDCHYLVLLNDVQIEITNVNQLKYLLHQAYSLEGLNAQDLYYKLTDLIYNYIRYNGQGNTNKCKLLKEICPNIEGVKELFLNLRILTMSNTIFERVDLTDVNYSNISELLNYLTEKIQTDNIELVDPSNPRL